MISFFEATQEEKDYFRLKFDSQEIEFIDEPLTDSLNKDLSQTEIISVFIYSKITEKIIKKCPNLKLIVTRSTGFDHINTIASKEANILVANVPAYGENTVAEHTFALILALSRKIVPSNERVKRNDYSLDGLRGFDLEGKTIGVVGTGKIGSKLAKMAAAFEMKIVAFDKIENNELKDQFGVKYMSLKELLNTADIVSLNLRHTAETHHIINTETIREFKKGAILVNTARGGLIDTPVLLKALDNGILAGVGLDVLEEEGSIKEDIQITSRQYTRKNLVIGLANALICHKQNALVTPHNAFNSIEAFGRIMNTTVDNIQAFQKGKAINLVSAE